MSPHAPSRILLVEDDSALSPFYFRALRRAGFMVALSSTGVSALEQLKANSFDLVILDWYLPEKNGLEVLREIRANELPTRVLMLSGSGEEVRQAALNSGADAFLAKPCGLDELTQTAASLLAGPCLAGLVAPA